MMNENELVERVHGILNERIRDSVPCRFCGRKMMVEVSFGVKRDGSAGFAMAMYCVCSEWQMVETELDILNLMETDCRG